MIQINGRTFAGSSVVMTGDRIIVDGRDVTDDSGVETKSVLSIEIIGTPVDVTSDRSISVRGSVMGNVHSGGSCNVGSGVDGDVQSGGSCNVGGSVRGSVNAGGSVNSH